MKCVPRSRYDLRSFPFDVQDLNLHLSVDNCTSLLPLDEPTTLQRYEGTKMLRHVPLSLPEFLLCVALFRAHAFDANRHHRLGQPHRLGKFSSLTPHNPHLIRTILIPHPHLTSSNPHLIRTILT